MKSKLLGAFYIFYACFMVFSIVSQFDFIKSVNPKLSAWMALFGAIGFIFIFVLAGISVGRASTKSTVITILVFFGIIAVVMITLYIVHEKVPGGANALHILFDD